MDGLVNVVTNNVARELLRIAAQNAMSINQFHIQINSITSFYKDKNSNLIEIGVENFKQYSSEEFLRDKSVHFEQHYDVDILKKGNNYPFKDVESEVVFEQNDTLVYLIIKEGSKVEYSEELYLECLDYIKEQQLRSNIMPYFFDIKNNKRIIKKFVDIAKKVQCVTFEKDKKILIARGLNEIESIESQVCMNIEEKNEVGVEDNQGKVDYSNRGFLLSCQEGEQLFEFIKPQQGKNGRTCRGDIIEVKTVNIDSRPTFTVDDSIEVQDSFEHIKYFSAKSGYLLKEGDKYDVSNSVDVDEISFKTTGTINSDLDSEISINVVKDDLLEDAIEEGMNVKVQNLFITGSIGPSTNIQAREMSVSGQTHNESSIKCVNAKIGQHKGKVIGRHVEVQTLDGGEIIADTVVIENAMRGKIRAKTVKIGVLGSHITMEASQSIEIRKVKGEENTLIIDTLVDSGFDNSKDDDEEYIKKLKEEIRDLLRTFKKATQNLKKNLKGCEKIKAAIIKSKTLNVEISQTLIKNFKICKIMRVRYKKLKEDIVYKKSQYKKLENKLYGSKWNVLDSKIILEEPINGYNRIIYKMYNPDVDIELKTDETMRGEVFKLVENEDGVLEIVNEN